MSYTEALKLSNKMKALDNELKALLDVKDDRLNATREKLATDIVHTGLQLLTALRSF